MKFKPLWFEYLVRPLNELMSDYAEPLFYIPKGGLDKYICYALPWIMLALTLFLLLAVMGGAPDGKMLKYILCHLVCGIMMAPMYFYIAMFTAQLLKTLFLLGIFVLFLVLAACGMGMSGQQATVTDEYGNERNVNVRDEGNTMVIDDGIMSTRLEKDGNGDWVDRDGKKYRKE